MTVWQQQPLQQNKETEQMAAVAGNSRKGTIVSKTRRSESFVVDGASIKYNEFIALARQKMASFPPEADITVFLEDGNLVFTIESN